MPTKAAWRKFLALAPIFGGIAHRGLAPVNGLSITGVADTITVDLGTSIANVPIVPGETDATVLPAQTP